MAQRKVIKIDQEKSDGCGQSIPACAEVALQIIDSKERLVSDVYRDSLGACLDKCLRCAKLGNINALKENLTGLCSTHKIENITIAHMEVPCCHGLLSIGQQALAESGKGISAKTIEMGIRGEKKFRVRGGK